MRISKIEGDAGHAEWLAGDGKFRVTVNGQDEDRYVVADEERGMVVVTRDELDVNGNPRRAKAYGTVEITPLAEKKTKKKK